MKNLLKSLWMRIIILPQSPNRPKDVRNFLQNELHKANDSLKKIDNLFNEFGGIDK